MKLYSYYRSSCSWRCRTALNLKDIRYEYIPVNLLQGEQHEERYTSVNPSGLVPCLVLDDGKRAVSQSLAIIEYLDEAFPQNSLLPKDLFLRAITRQAAQIIAADTQPLQNLRLLRYIGEGRGEEWAREVIKKGLAAFQALLVPYSGTYCVGDEVTIADIVLVPQLYNARRFNVDLEGLDKLLEIEKRLMQLDAFVEAAPDSQPDCPKTA